MAREERRDERHVQVHAFQNERLVRQLERGDEALNMAREQLRPSRGARAVVSTCMPSRSSVAIHAQRRGEHLHARQVIGGNQRACDCARYPRRTRWRRADEMRWSAFTARWSAFTARWSAFTARWSALVLAVGLPTALRTALLLLPAEVPAGGRRVGLSALLAAGLGSGEVARGEVASGEVASGGPSVVKAAAFSWPSPAVSDGL